MNNSVDLVDLKGVAQEIMFRFKNFFADHVHVGLQSYWRMIHSIQTSRQSEDNITHEIGTCLPALVFAEVE
ncbi:MAG: hypothetical protein A2284_00735 [Deltaproteobacteria bacterium RIFOXYA12_FULL_61_11]|nr:MAG: hypothetical protein A2284_00735 [Deltaproteobacteria bacterium RIFOXYA12_FULL_61_11]